MHLESFLKSRSGNQIFLNYQVVKKFDQSRQKVWSPWAEALSQDDRLMSCLSLSLSLSNTCEALFVVPVPTSVVTTLPAFTKTTRKMMSSIVLISKHSSSSHDLGLDPSNTAEWCGEIPTWFYKNGNDMMRRKLLANRPSTRLSLVQPPLPSEDVDCTMK